MNGTGTLSACLAAAILLGACEKATPRAKPSPPPSPSPQVSISNPPLPDCEYPKKIKFPKWVPEDLPLPEGTYAMQKLEPLAGYMRGLFVVKMPLDELTTFVLDRWPKEGWVLGRGDSEPGEIEDQFGRTPAVGAFKAQSVFCNPGFAIMYLIYAKERPPTPSPAPGISSPQGSPLQPSPSPGG